MGLGESRYS